MNEATIQKIIDIQPIEGADRIEVCSVLGWKVVVQKGLHKVGDFIIYIAIDSILPKLPQYEFIKSTKTTEDGKEWFYVRTVKLRKQISQGLILRLESLQSEKYDYNIIPNHLIDENNKKLTNIICDGKRVIDLIEGLDVSEYLGVQHYEKPIPANMTGTVRGSFPSFISKTDETNIQTIPEAIEQLKGKPYYITEKCDGTSFTAYYQEGNLHVCSRNLELVENPDNAYWKVAKKYDLLNVLGNNEGGYLAIQGELCGPGIQKNPMGLQEVDLFVFNIYDIQKAQYFNYNELCSFCDNNKLKMVSVIKKSEAPFKLFEYTLEQLLEIAKGKYKGTENHREGIVVRSLDKEISFKVLNNDFLMGEK